MLLAVANVFAQDIITKKNGEEIKAKVLNVSDSEINYIKWSNQNGPTYTIAVTQVSMIKYENGETDVFNKEASPTTTTDHVAQGLSETTFSPYAVQQMKQNNLDLLKRQDLLKRAKRCKGWGTALFWTILIGGGVGMYFALEPDFDSWPTIGCSLGVAVAAATPMAILYTKANKLNAEAEITAMSIPIKTFEIGNISVEPNVNLLTSRIDRTRALGLGTKINF